MIARIFALWMKELVRGPRSSAVLLALAYPFIIALIIQVVFGALFEQRPRIGVVDEGNSAIAGFLRDRPGIDLHSVDSQGALWEAVKSGDLDAGLHLPAGLDASIRRGERPPLDFHLSRAARPMTVARIQAALGAALRRLGPAPPVRIERVRLRDKAPKPWRDRILPILVLLAMIAAGCLVAGFSVVDEKVRGTLQALLVTPVSLVEVLIAKGLWAGFIAVVCGVLTLVLGGATSSVGLGAAVALGLTSILCVELGLLIGLYVSTVDGLYAALKGIGPLLLISGAPFVWDAFPEWIARLSPTWYVLQPLWAFTQQGQPLDAQAANLGVATVICAGLAGLTAWAARRVQRRGTLG